MKKLLSTQEGMKNNQWGGKFDIYETNVHN